MRARPRGWRPLRSRSVRSARVLRRPSPHSSPNATNSGSDSRPPRRYFSLPGSNSIPAPRGARTPAPKLQNAHHHTYNKSRHTWSHGHRHRQPTKSVGGDGRRPEDIMHTAPDSHAAQGARRGDGRMNEAAACYATRQRGTRGPESGGGRRADTAGRPTPQAPGPTPACERVKGCIISVMHNLTGRRRESGALTGERVWREGLWSETGWKSGASSPCRAPAR